MGVIPDAGNAGISRGISNVFGLVICMSHRSRERAGLARGGQRWRSSRQRPRCARRRPRRARRAAQARPSHPCHRQCGVANGAGALVDALGRTGADRPLPRLSQPPPDRAHVRGPVRRDAPAMWDELRLLDPRSRRRGPPVAPGGSLGADRRLRTSRYRGAGPARRASPSPSHRRRGSTSRGCPRPTTSAFRAIGSRVTALRSRAQPRRGISVNGLTCGTSYAFTVVAYDAAGNVSLPTSIGASTEACPAPTPCTPMAVRPGDDLEALAATKPVATVFCIAPGTYRVHSEIRPRDGQQFVGTGPGVVITGGVPLAGFAHSGALWTASGTPTTVAYAEGEGFSGYLYPQAPYANDVAVDGVPPQKTACASGARSTAAPSRLSAPGSTSSTTTPGRSRLGQIPPAMTSRWALRRTGLLAGLRRRDPRPGARPVHVGRRRHAEALPPDGRG